MELLPDVVRKMRAGAFHVQHFELAFIVYHKGDHNGTVHVVLPLLVGEDHILAELPVQFFLQLHHLVGVAVCIRFIITFGVHCAYCKRHGGGNDGGDRSFH